MDKIAEIKKHFKKDKLFLELKLTNYENHNIYIIINYISKTKNYKISWFDLDYIEKNNIEKYISYEYFQEDLVKNIEDIIKISNINEYKVITEEENIIELNIYKEKIISISFNKYLPKEISIIANIFALIFDNLPRKLESYFFEIVAIITNNVNHYEYRRRKNFDIFNSNLNLLFSEEIIKEGEEYYKKGKIKYLEKIDNKYYCTIKGKKDYSIIIEYDEKNKKTKLFCTCPCDFFCKHLVAEILAIRDNNFKKFYKIVFNNPNQNILENIARPNFFLCLGIEENAFIVINQFGMIEKAPIKDKKGNILFKIIEDDDNKTLSKKIKELI